jgi:phosphoglycolate phosphatase-like HAD superfamily hydrolase
VERVLQNRNDAIRVSLEEQARQIDGTLSDVDKALAARGNAVRTALDDRTRELNSMLSGRAAELNQIVDEKIAPIIETYAATGREAAEQISMAARASADRLRSENAALMDAMVQRAEAAAGSLNEVETTLSTNVNSLIDRLQQSNTGIATTVGRATDNLLAVNEAMDEVANRFGETAERASERVTASTRFLEGKVDKLSSISADTLAQVSNIVARFSDHSKVLGQASDLLSAAQSNLSNTLEDREEALRQLALGLVRRSDEIAESMRSLGEMVEGAFDRAEQRSSQVAGNLRQGIQSSFADVGRVLSDTEKRTNEVAENLRDTMSRAGQEASQSLDTSFSNVNRLIDETEKRSAAAAESLRNTVASATQGANQLLDNAFGEAEKRANGLSERMLTSLNSSLGELDQLMDASARKSGAAANTMREALRQAVEEAVARFDGATEEIRRSATEIRKELDMTRNELKRGAFDLPEEAKESAAAMRRAVAEQIKALQDISQIVGKSTRQFEVSDQSMRAMASAQPAPPRPQPQPQQQVIPDDLGMRGSLPIERTPVAPQRPPEPRREPVRDVAPEPVREPVRENREVRREAQPEIRERPRSEIVDRTRAPQPEENRAEGGGWISDLLRAASREESPAAAPAPRQPAAPAARPAPEAPAAPRAQDQRNPRHMVESLNSLSVDIARAIDHDASVDLWRRYQRGERDVFTRRLYTLKGQQTFDDIKQKYEREPEFRTAVDRYIADFEKLLGDVARTDRDKTITQSYLTSDTGKVYTMLAHASGRFS